MNDPESHRDNIGFLIPLGGTIAALGSKIFTSETPVLVTRGEFFFNFFLPRGPRLKLFSRYSDREYLANGPGL